MLVARQAEAAARQLASWYPVVAITGPRQSGKTTLARGVFGHMAYVSLEAPDNRDFALQDPRGFLSAFPEGAVIDEAQRAPELFSYLQVRVDETRRTGQFVLTGSQQFGLLARISQSLAGRVGLLHLLPFSLSELTAGGYALGLEALLSGGQYPPVYDCGVPPHVWYSDYVTTYVERDARQLVDIRDLDAFRRFVRMCASRTAQPVNLSALGADCGVTHNTAKAWLSVLEASYIAFRLPPHARNFGKRLVKTPKLYFYDSGLAAWLTGVESAAQLTHGAMRGALFETWVVSEFVKHRCNRLLSPNLYFWRDASGTEVDLIVERGETLYPLDIKSGQTVAADWFDSLRQFTAKSGGPAGCVVFGGEAAQRRGDISVLGWKQIGAALSQAFD